MRDDRARLLARKARIEEQLAQLAKAEAMKREQDQKRRTLLAGRIVLDHATKDDAFGRVLMDILDRAITAPRDRALFAFGSERAGETEEGRGQMQTEVPGEGASVPG